ncbi:MAG: hypothetical protein IT351_03160 [Candidatus Fermentibacter sp.]|nr:hypothetical protein [Candidatus Fermentibacter sp.]
MIKRDKRVNSDQPRPEPSGAGWRRVLILAASAGLLTRIVHFAFYLAGPLSHIYYLPVLGAYRFETSALEILSGVPQDAPYLYASPIFTYLVIPFYALGAGRLPLLAVQALTGASIPVLIVLLAKRLGSGPVPAAVGALIWAFYAPPMFLELTVLPVTLAALTTTLVVLLTVSDRPRTSLLVAAGAACGILAGIRAPLAVVFLPLAAAYWRRGGGSAASRVTALAGSAVAGALVLLPLALYQRDHFAGFTPFPSCGGFNLVLGHADDASGYGPPAPSMGLVETSSEDIGQVAMRIAFESGGVTDFAEADAYWRDIGLRLILDRPVQEVELTLRKLGGFFGAVPFDVYYDLSRLGRFNPALGPFLVPRWLLIGFFTAFLPPFVVWGRHRTAALFPAAAALGTVILFFHCERFVLPAVPVMMAAGASGATALFTRRSVPVRARAMMVLAGLSLMAPAVLRPTPVVPEGIYLQSIGARAYNAGDKALALTFYERAALESPSGTFCWYESHVSAAELLEQAGDLQRARQHVAEIDGWRGTAGSR